MELLSTLLWIIPILLIAAIIIAIALQLKNNKGIDVKQIGTTIGLIIITIAIVIPVIGHTTDNLEIMEFPDTLYYDDYQPTNAIEANGALEIIEIDNQKYCHAKDVGEGQIIWGDEKSKTITVNKANLDVVLFMGQSNIEYWEGKIINGTYYVRSDPVTAEPKSKLGTTYYYGNEERPFTHSDNDLTNMAIYDMNSIETGLSKIGGLDYPFAANYAKETGNKCLVVNCGWSGTSINYYVPGEKVYEHAKLGWNDAISKIDTDRFNVNIIGYVFCQGESDTYTEIAQYKSDFLEMHNSLIGESEEEFSTYKLPKCYIDLIRERRGINSSIAQKQLIQEYDTIIMGTTVANTFTMDNGGLLPDNLHYTQEGQNIIAENIVPVIVRE